MPFEYVKKGIVKKTIFINSYYLFWFQVLEHYSQNIFKTGIYNHCTFTFPFICSFMCCMCVFMFVCVRAHVWVYVHVGVWVCVHVCVHVHMGVLVWGCMCMWVCECACLCTCAVVCACAEVDTGDDPQSSSWSFKAWSHKWNSELIDTTGLFSHAVLGTSCFCLLGGNPNTCPHACREALTTEPSPQPYISF